VFHKLRNSSGIVEEERARIAGAVLAGSPGDFGNLIV